MLFCANAFAETITVDSNSTNNVTLPTGGNTYFVDTGGDFTFSGIFSGTGSFTKTGLGSLFLSNTANTFTGGTIVTEGTLKIADFNSINPDSLYNSVSGTGSELISNTLLRVGWSGTGHLNITGGGKATSTGAIIVSYSNIGTGTVNVSGSGSELTSGDDLFVGTYGTGYLNISGGGKATTMLATGGIMIGNSASGNGTVNVSGNNSELTSGGVLRVGQSGTGHLNITDEGKASAAAYVVIGIDTTGIGTVNVSGNNSELTSGYYLTVGYVGTGHLNITNGGKATSTTFTRIGSNVTSIGTVNVSGTDSEFIVGSDLFVGDSGTGHLNISDGGKANATQNIIVGYLTGGIGTVNVSGSGSELTNSGGSLEVGYNGTGTLNITDGGKATSTGNITVGSFATGIGTVNVSGAGSELTSGDYLYVGGGSVSVGGKGTLAGTGTVTATNGVKVWGGDHGTLSAGDYAGQVGTLNINGDLTMESGSVLRVDLGASNTADKIAVTGNATLNGTINIDFTSLANAGTFEIMTSTGMTAAPTLNYRLNGEDISTSSRITGTPNGSVTANVLSVDTAPVTATNQTVIWNGSGTPTATWNLSNTNWTGGATTFLDGDAAGFGSVNGGSAATPQVITLGGTGKTVAQMDIGGTGTNIVFNGNILADGTKTNLTTNNSGKLIIAGMNGGTVTLNGENEFVSGITMDSGTLVLGNDKVLGTYQTNTATPADSRGQVTVDSGTSTIKTNDNRVISNRFVNNSAAGELTFDIAAGKTLTIDGVKNTATGNINGVGGAIQVKRPNNGGLTFFGNGNLVLSNNSVDGGDGGGAIGTRFTTAGENSVLNFLGLSSIQFLNNSSSFDGGAIQSYSNTTGNSTITMGNNVLFRDNKATGGGGAIYTGGASTSLTFGDNITFSNNSADGAGGGGGIYSNATAGDSIVDFDNNITFSGNTTNGSGGGIYANVTGGTGNSTLTFGNDVSFTGNTAGDLGGGVFAFSNGGSADVTFGNNTAFKDNEAVTEGGGIYIFGDTGAALTFGTNAVISGNKSDADAGGGILADSNGNIDIIFGNNAAISDNESSDAGGGICADSSSNVDIAFGSNTTFSGNNASTSGGGIYAHSSNAITLTFGNKTTFSDNTAGGGGGIFANSTSDTTLTFDSNTLFSGNSASIGNGGGIFDSSPNTTTLTFGNNTLFSGNTASSSGSHGGGIYFNGPASSLNLNTGAGAGKGDIAFTGNTHQSGTPNSIYLAGSTALQISGDGNVYFDDPIAVGTQGGNSLTKTGTGFVQFVGNNVLNPTGVAGGSVTVNGGTFRLADNASFATQGTGATFTAAAGTTLAGNGTITAEQGFTINGTISPDAARFAVPDFDTSTNTFAAGNTTIADDKKIGTLNLDGNVSLNGAVLAVDLGASNASDKIAVTGAVSHGTNSSVDISAWQTGTFEILTAASGINAASFDAVAVNGTAQTGRQYATLTDGGGTALTLTAANQNRTVIWNGGTGNWNTTTSNTNWLDGATGEYFMDGDAVTFSSAGTKTVAAGGVTVASMSITAGENTFTGGNIVSTSTVIGNSVTPTQQFNLTGGSASFSNTNLNFAGGVSTSAGTSLQLSGSVLQTAGTASIAGDFAGTGTLNATGGTTFTNNTISPGDSSGTIGTLNITGSAALNGATLVIDLGASNASDKIAVTGAVSHGTNSSVDISTWQTGTFTGILTAASGIDYTKFNAVTIGGAVLGDRQSAVLSGTGTSLNLTTSASNLDLTWSGGTDGNWDTTTANNWLPTGEKYNADDYVIFDNTAAVQTVTVGQVQVSGMEITGGNYVFNGVDSSSKITGTNPASGAQTRTGILDIANANVTLNTATDFVNGTQLNNAAAVLGHDEAFGVFGTDSRGIVNAYGNTTIQTAADRSVENRFVSSAGGNLTFDVAAGTTMTFDGSHNTSIAAQSGVNLVSNGDTVFTGTTNSITLSSTPLNLSGNGNVYFDTPITSAGGGNSLTKTGTGFVQFAGNNVLNPTGVADGSVAVNAGTFRLADNASFATRGTGATFTAAAGTTLAGNGTITAEQGFTINGTIFPDAARFTPGSTTIADNEKIGTLNLVGNAQFDGTKFAIDLESSNVSDKVTVTGAVSHGTNSTVDISAWETGTFEILTAASGIDAAKFDAVTVNGSAQTGRQYATLTDGGGTALTLTAANQNLGVTWNGGSGNWNTTASNTNWLDGATNEYFINGDSVTFDSATAQTVTIDAGGVTVADMTITGGENTFTGGNIVSTSTVIGNSVTPTQQFNLTGGSATFSNTNLNFVGGINTLAGTTLKLSSGSTLQTAATANIDGTLAGTGTLNATGGTTFNNGSAISPGGSTGEIGTLNLAGNVHFNGTMLGIDLDTSTSDKINVTGNVTLGVNTNIISLANWKEGTYDIVAASILDSIDNKFSVELQGQALTADDFTLSYIGGNLRLLTRHETPDNFYEWDDETDNSGNLSNDDNFPTDVIVHYAGQGTEDVNVEGTVELAGLIVSDQSDYNFHAKTKDDTTTGIVITHNDSPEFANQRYNGKMAVTDSSNVIISVPVDAEYGTTIENSGVTIANNGSLGSYQQNTSDDSRSAGQTTIIGNVSLNVSGGITTATRTVVTENAVLTVTAGETDAVTFSGVQADGINGASFNVEKANLNIAGNVAITDNSTTGTGGGIYANESNITLDSTQGGIEIANNTDSNGSSDIALAGEGNKIEAVGENETSGIVVDTVVAAPGSSGNKLIINTSSYVQMQNGQLNAQPGTNHYDNEVDVERGKWRIVNEGTFDVGGSYVYVAEAGTAAGNGTIISSDFDIRGGLSPDNAVLRPSSSVIARKDQRGNITLQGNVIQFSGARINVELIDETEFDYVKTTSDVQYTATKNSVNVNSWAEGTFTVLEQPNNFAADTIPNHFDLTFGGDAVGTRQGAELLLNGNLLRVRTWMDKADRKELTWVGGDGYWNTSSAGQWKEKSTGGDENFNHTDYVTFDGGTGTVTLGKAGVESYVPQGRTVSGMLVAGGNYTFTGGDLFGVKKQYKLADGYEGETEGKLVIADGTHTFRNNIFFEGNIEILNGASVELLDKKAFHSGNDWILANTATLNIEPGDNLIKGRSVQLDGKVVLENEPVPLTKRPYTFHNMIEATETPLDRTRLSEIFNATIVLLNRQAVFSNNGLAMDLFYSTVPLGEYAQSHNFTENETVFADYFADSFNNYEMQDFEEYLMTLDDAQLDILFGLFASSAIYAEAKLAAMSNPYRTVSRNFSEWRKKRYDGVCSTAPRTNHRIWFTTNQQDIRQNGSKNIIDYGISRTGTNAGVDYRITGSLQLGMVFGYADSKLYQTGNRIDLDDYTMGIYARKKLTDMLELNGFVGYGEQNYSAHRQTFGGTARSRFDGNSLFATLELVRPLQLRKSFTLFPTWALDYQTANTDAFAESGTIMPQVFESSELEQTVMRFGINSQWQWSDNARFDSRLQYGRQIGGADITSIRTAFPSVSTVEPLTLGGTRLGRDRLNVGVGGRYYLTDSKRSILVGNYDFDRGNRSKSHTAELGFQQIW
ncbi:hypothetical protein FACS18942_03910 [Planctomycetales bacterium]|nr:hypothetical protein FACS18942_03910 [Planctomycetales bacterium]